MNADRHWLLTFDPHAARVDIIGPYDTGLEAVAAGRGWQERNGDSPCWNTLRGLQPQLTIVPPRDMPAGPGITTASLVSIGDAA